MCPLSSPQSDHPDDDHDPQTGHHDHDGAEGGGLDSGGGGGGGDDAAVKKAVDKAVADKDETIEELRKKLEALGHQSKSVEDVGGMDTEGLDAAGLDEKIRHQREQALKKYQTTNQPPKDKGNQVAPKEENAKICARFRAMLAPALFVTTVFARFSTDTVVGQILQTAQHSAEQYIGDGRERGCVRYVVFGFRLLVVLGSVSWWCTVLGSRARYWVPRGAHSSSSEDSHRHPQRGGEPTDFGATLWPPISSKIWRSWFPNHIAWPPCPWL